MGGCGGGPDSVGDSPLGSLLIIAEAAAILGAHVRYLGSHFWNRNQDSVSSAPPMFLWSVSSNISLFA